MSDCTDPYISRVEYAPHEVPYKLDDGELVVDPAGVELLDAPWNETDEWMCQSCETWFDSEEEAREHIEEYEEVSVDGE